MHLFSTDTRWPSARAWWMEPNSPPTELKKEGVHFRNEMEVGPGGRQIQVEDPDGNLIELFEPADKHKHY